MISNRDYCTILLSTKAVLFNFETPFEFASGLKSPIYCDNRIVLSNAEIRKKIAHSLHSIIHILETHPKTIEETTDYMYKHYDQYINSTIDTIVGVATAGIPWATLCANSLDKPLSYARSTSKGHGKKSQFEGATVTNKSVIVIEDVISSATSAVTVVEACRKQNATVTAVVSLFTYNFTHSKETFSQAKCPHLSIASFETLAKTALDTHYITQTQYTQLQEWHSNVNALHSENPNTP